GSRWILGFKVKVALEVKVKVALGVKLNDPSQPNAEGITALHNAICGANYGIVEFLIACGADVNSPDSHGWTPLHCAASCNDTSVCVALVQHGAAVFATTSSDGSLAADKCDPFRDGYADCYSYLTGVEQSMGVLNRGVVYALWDYRAALADELSFREGDPVTVLRRPPPPRARLVVGGVPGRPPGIRAQELLRALPPGAAAAQEGLRGGRGHGGAPSWPSPPQPPGTPRRLLGCPPIPAPPLGPRVTWGCPTCLGWSWGHVASAGGG
ncbi:hypothetical protein Q9233_017512, partial [Columba guinea]